MKIYYFAAMLFVSLSASAQEWVFEAPDYEAIKDTMYQPGSPSDYNALFARFLEGDTTLTVNQSRLIYYGYTHLEAYSPYGRVKDEFDPFLEMDPEDMSKKDWKAFAKECERVLAEDPFNMRAMIFQGYVGMKRGDEAVQALSSAKQNVLINALVSSGNGMEPETAFYVITTTHEYELLSVFGFEFGGQQSLIGDCDELTLAENEYGLEALYFNVSAPLKTLNLLFDE